MIIIIKKLILTLMFLFTTSSLFAGHVDIEIQPKKEIEKIQFSYFAKKTKDKTQFEFKFTENPSNTDGELWASSIFSYGRLVIKTKSEVIAKIDINNSYFGKGLAVFKFQLKNSLIENSYFEFVTYPVIFNDLKHYLLFRLKHYPIIVKKDAKSKKQLLELEIGENGVPNAASLPPCPMHGNFYIMKLKNFPPQPNPSATNNTTDKKEGSEKEK